MSTRLSGRRVLAAVTVTLSVSLTPVLTGLVAPATAAAAPAEQQVQPSTPIVDVPVVVAHRGASGYRPEHTLAAYRLAIAQGADYIEPDLVSTKDGHLVARHENEISGTTDVSTRPRFADRRTTKMIDGVPVTGWFTEDFTLDELKTLRAKERLPQVRPANTAYDGQFKVPTFPEVLRLARKAGVGVYPETKHPTYFDSIGLSLEEPLLKNLAQTGMDDADDDVIIQSFEVSNLRELAPRTEVDIAQLINRGGAPYDQTAAGSPLTYAQMTTPAGLAQIATYADGIGAEKRLVLPYGAAQPTPLVDDAHAENLIVHVWTLRRENQFMDPTYRIGTDPNAPGDLARETKAFLDAGVDGLFSDHPDLAVAARDDWLASR